MSEEVYLSNSEWIKTHDNIGGVKATVILKNNISHEDFEKIFKSTYFILCDEDYIINLQNQLQQKENIIKEIREKCDYLLNNDTVEINGKTYIKQEADNVVTNYIKEVLDKENNNE